MYVLSELFNYEVKVHLCVVTSDNYIFLRFLLPLILYSLLVYGSYLFDDLTVLSCGSTLCWPKGVTLQLDILWLRGASLFFGSFLCDSILDALFLFEDPYTGRIFIPVGRNVLYVTSKEHNLTLPSVLWQAGLELNDTSQLHCEQPTKDQHAVIHSVWYVEIHPERSVGRWYNYSENNPGGNIMGSYRWHLWIICRCAGGQRLWYDWTRIYLLLMKMKPNWYQRTWQRRWQIMAWT